MNYLVDGWEILVSQHRQKVEMLLAYDNVDQAMWEAPVRQGTLSKMVSTTRNSYYNKVSTYQATVAALNPTLLVEQRFPQKMWQDRLVDMPVFACCFGGTAAI